MHLYTAFRTSDDMDAKFEPRILLRDIPVIAYEDEKNGPSTLGLDRNYMGVIALMHPDWQKDAWFWKDFGRSRAM